MLAGYLWFVVQGVLGIGAIFALFVSHTVLPWPLRATGMLLGIGGVALIVISYRILGKSHSPWTKPIAGATLVTRGPYAVVRHPVYLGYILAFFGLALLFASPLGLAASFAIFVYYDLRTRWEDRELERTYPGFAAYRGQVRGRLIPYLY